MRGKTKKPKILVVDDEIDNLELLYRTFYRDYQVLQAESGHAALEILAREKDLSAIISDQRMPMMSGTEFLRLAAVQYPDIMRIILTGYTDVEDLVEAINSGKVFKYVTKPWEPEPLKEVVRQAIETHNVLKVRTNELSRSLRRESLLNTVTNTIRNAQYGRSGESPLREVLQTIVTSLGQVLGVDLCILRPFEEGQLGREFFIHEKGKLRDPANGSEVSQENDFYLHSNLELTVWETREIEVIHDVTESDRARGEIALAFERAGISSTLVVPLMFQMELMAVLALHRCGGPQLWEDDEIQLALMVADQAALAISQARAYEQVQALAQRESLVNTITNAIRSSLEPQEIFSAITQQLGSSLDLDGCALSLWTEEDEFMSCVALYERESSALQIPQSRVPIISNPVLQQLLQTKQPVVIGDLEATPSVEMKGGDLPLRSPARALLVVPLLVDGKIIGSISLRQTRQPRRWSAADIELARVVASQAAIAVQQSRLYQKTRQQAERLLELDRQKTEFFQNVSHELRTPLTLTLGPLESAVSKNQGLPLDQAQIALRNSRRLLRLVNQLLDLQRLDAGRMQPIFRPCNLGEFIEQIIATFRPYCEKKRLDLQLQLSLCETIYLDLEKFDKVLYNLLSNAMKFTHPGGRITVTLEPAGDYVRLQVRDTGIGIAPSQIPHLFERFRQAEGSIARSYEGTGLGLALVKEMVDLHGGQIAVESVKGDDASQDVECGTTFTIWLSGGTAHLPIEQVLEVPLAVQTDRAAVELADLEAELLDLEQLSVTNDPLPVASVRGIEGGREDHSRSNRSIAQFEADKSRGTRSEIAAQSSVCGDNPKSVLESVPATTQTSDPEETSESLALNRLVGQVEAAPMSPNSGGTSPSPNLKIQHPKSKIEQSLVLVVEDNPDMRAYVSGILARANYQVCTARNGEEGWQVLQKRHPQLIVTDLMMPKVSGLDLIRLTRNHPELKGTPMILLTAKADEESRVTGTERGADAYLAKPFNDRELLAEVRNLLALKENEQRVKQLNEYLTESVLARFLPPEMVKRAAQGELTLDLQPEPRLVTILFSDIVGFTPLSNTLQSRRIAQLLNEYLEAMAEAIFAAGGTVDKFIGDAIVALFGAPEDLTPNEQVQRAIAAARKMLETLEGLNQRWQKAGILGGDGPPLLQFRCGIHQGSVVVGMFGSHQRSDYTAIGPAVNLASRLQEAAQPNTILISSTVADYLEAGEVTQYDSLKLKGVDEEVLTFLVQ
jgi:GAF domain-containing protein